MAGKVSSAPVTLNCQRKLSSQFTFEGLDKIAVRLVAPACLVDLPRRNDLPRRSSAKAGVKTGAMRRRKQGNGGKASSAAAAPSPIFNLPFRPQVTNRAGEKSVKSMTPLHLR